MFAIITKYSTETNRVEKFIKDFATEQDALDNLPDGYPDAFVAVQPDSNDTHWLVDPVTKTLSYDPVPQSPPPTDAQRAETRMINDPLQRALIKREADQRGITPRQLMNEIMGHA